VRNEEECVCSAPNCCDTEQRSASQPGSVASGALYILSVAEKMNCEHGALVEWCIL
jgi:hypothetical protein